MTFNIHDERANDAVHEKWNRTGGCSSPSVSISRRDKTALQDHVLHILCIKPHHVGKFRDMTIAEQSVLRRKNLTKAGSDER